MLGSSRDAPATAFSPDAMVMQAVLVWVLGYQSCLHAAWQPMTKGRRC